MSVLPRRLVLLIAAVLLVGFAACHEKWPPSSTPWPEVGTPGTFDPTSGPGTGSKVRADRSVGSDILPDSARRDGVNGDGGGSPCGSSCGPDQYCMERLTPFSTQCLPVPTGCTSCSCLGVALNCLCVPPPGAVVICPT